MLFYKGKRVSIAKLCSLLNEIEEKKNSESNQGFVVGEKYMFIPSQTVYEIKGFFDGGNGVTLCVVPDGNNTYEYSVVMLKDSNLWKKIS